MTLSPTRARAIAAKLPLGRAGDWAANLLKFYADHHYVPSLFPPRSFNAGLLAVKTREANHPVRRTITDKEWVKTYISERTGEQYVIPTIGVIRRRENVRRFDFSLSSIAKATHGSGQCKIFSRKPSVAELDALEAWFGLDFYGKSREANYKGLQPKVIVEQFITFGSGLPPKDYRLFCFFSEPKLIFVDTPRIAGVQRTIYTARWEPLPFGLRHPIGEVEPPPANLPEMLRVARALSSDLKSLRVDMFTDGSRIYVTELTNCHGAAEQRFHPDPSTDFRLGQLFADPTFEIDPTDF